MQAAIERNLEMKMAINYTEILNRIARLEMRTEQISAAGDMVVGQLAVWIGRAQTLFVQFDEQSLRHQEELEQQSRKHKEDLERMSAALNDLIQQTRTQFQHVDDSQQILHARDLDILRSDLQTHFRRHALRTGRPSKPRCSLSSPGWWLVSTSWLWLPPHPRMTNGFNPE